MRPVGRMAPPTFSARRNCWRDSSDLEIRHLWVAAEGEPPGALIKVTSRLAETNFLLSVSPRLVPRVSTGGCGPQIEPPHERAAGVLRVVDSQEPIDLGAGHRAIHSLWIDHQVCH